MAENKHACAIYLHALTPIHAGTGQVSASGIDLPIAREKATNWPVLPASSLKGVLRAAVVRAGLGDDVVRRLFGWQDGDDGQAGRLQIGDARLLCFPVRTWTGVFAYISCPLALLRLLRDFKALGIPTPFDAGPPEVTDTTALTADGAAIIDNGLLWLEDIQLAASANESVGAIAQGIARAVFDEGDRKTFLERFVIVSNDIFDFLADTATEVVARIALNPDSKTVDKEKGALWYEETVPSEAIFVSPVLGDALPSGIGGVIQIGGNETIGRGLCRISVNGGTL